MTTLFSLRPVFAVDKGNYVNVSASAGQIWSWGGGGGGIWKIVCTSNPGYAPGRAPLSSSPPPTLPC